MHGSGSEEVETKNESRVRIHFRLVMYGSIQKQNFIGGSNHLLELRPVLSGIRSFSYTLMITVEFVASLYITINVC